MILVTKQQRMSHPFPFGKVTCCNCAVMLFVFILSATLTTESYAYSASLCLTNIRGVKQNTRFRLNKISISPGGQREQDITHSVGEWNKIRGMEQRFYTLRGPDDSNGISNNDGINEIYFADLGNSLNGYAYLRRAFCSSTSNPEENDGRVLEADVAITSRTTLPGGLLPGWVANTCRSTGRWRRGTVLHEFGHVLGMKHQTSLFSVMNDNGGPHGKYCGPNEDAPHADDVNFALQYHRDPQESGIDGAVLGYRLNSSTGARILTMPREVRRCDIGDSLAVQFSFGNRGTIDISSGSPMNYQIRFSSNVDITNFDPLVATGSIWASSGEQKIVSRQVTIPSSLSNGSEYFIGVMVDAPGTFGESNEENNTTYLGTKIRVESGAC